MLKFAHDDGYVNPSRVSPLILEARVAQWEQSLRVDCTRSNSTLCIAHFRDRILHIRDPRQPQACISRDQGHLSLPGV